MGKNIVFQQILSLPIGPNTPIRLLALKPLFRDRLKGVAVGVLLANLFGLPMVGWVIPLTYSLPRVVPEFACLLYRNLWISPDGA